MAADEERDFMLAQVIDRLSFSVSGPRHIVTEFQDVGGAGALGEEEGAQACAVHHTNTKERIFPCKHNRIFPLKSECQIQKATHLF